MSVVLHEVTTRLAAAYRRGSHLLLLCDYDGTLTPLVARPELAVLDAGMQRVLTALLARPRVHVGVISGRKLDNLQAAAPLRGLSLAGTGGMELLLHGQRIVHPRARQITEMMERLAVELNALAMMQRGAWVESKGLAIAVHYRQLPEDQWAELQAEVTQSFAPWADELRVIQGPKAWEIVAVNGWTKGTAVRLILADLGEENCIPFYAGDADNDAEAIAQVTALGGVAVGIGADAPPTAQYRLPHPAALRMFFERLQSALERRRPQLSQSR